MWPAGTSVASGRITYTLPKVFFQENSCLITRQSSILGVPAGRGLNPCLDWVRLSQGPTLGRATSPIMARDGLCLCPQAKESCGSL